MIKKVDHFVITTNRLQECLNFYGIIGFQTLDQGACWVLKAGDFKINVHIRGKELLPNAQTVQCGSADFCLEIDEQLDCVISDLREKGVAIELGIVTRHGVKGVMDSIYLRDPDGNLIELCHYRD